MSEFFDDNIAPLRNNYGFLSRSESSNIGAFEQAQVDPQLDKMIKLRTQLSRESSMNLAFETAQFDLGKKVTDEKKRVAFMGRTEEATKDLDGIVNQTDDEGALVSVFERTKLANEWAMKNPDLLTNNPAANTAFMASLEKLNTEAKQIKSLDDHAGKLFAAAQAGTPYAGLLKIAREDGTLTSQERIVLNLAKKMDKARAASAEATKQDRDLQLAKMKQQALKDQVESNIAGHQAHISILDDMLENPVVTTSGGTDRGSPVTDTPSWRSYEPQVRALKIKDEAGDVITTPLAAKARLIELQNTERQRLSGEAPTPTWLPKPPTAGPTAEEKLAEFLLEHPDADADGDGTLTEKEKQEYLRLDAPDFFPK
jgi:hypothetical protein